MHFQVVFLTCTAGVLWASIIPQVPQPLSIMSWLSNPACIQFNFLSGNTGLGQPATFHNMELWFTVVVVKIPAGSNTLFLAENGQSVEIMSSHFPAERGCDSIRDFGSHVLTHVQMLKLSNVLIHDTEVVLVFAWTKKMDSPYFEICVFLPRSQWSSCDNALII